MSVKKLVISALFLSLCYVLPFVSGGIPVVGNMLCLMHIPVMLAGYILGWPYALAIGLIAPITRSFFFGTPILYPNAICMALELASYGVFADLFNKLFNKIKLNKNLSLILSLVIAMIIGRIIWGASKWLLLSFTNNPFTFELFIVGAILNAWPGMIIQIILVPLLVKAVKKD